MSTKTIKKQEWALASYALQDALTDFYLSRQALLCSPRTLKWYQWTLGKISQWLFSNGVTSPEEITARHIRAVCRQNIWDKTSVLLRDSFQPSHNMIIHGQAASFACVFAALSSA